MMMTANKKKNGFMPQQQRQQQQAVSVVSVVSAVSATTSSKAGRRRRRQVVVALLSATNKTPIIMLLLLLLLFLSSFLIMTVATADSDTAQVDFNDNPDCGLWLGPSPIKEAEEHGWGHSIFTGKLIKKGQIVLGSGDIYDFDTENNDNDNDNDNELGLGSEKMILGDYSSRTTSLEKKILGDLFIPVYDWEELDMGKSDNDNDIDDDDDDDDKDGNNKDSPPDGGQPKPRAQTRGNNRNRNRNGNGNGNKAKENDDEDNIGENSQLFQQLWNGDYYHEQVIESYDSMRTFIPGLSNIAPCTSDNFNLEQIQAVSYRDWRRSTSTTNEKKDDENKKDKSQSQSQSQSQQHIPPSHQSGSFSYWSNAMFVASRDIQVGEELVVECSDNSDEFNPKDYPPVDFKPKESGGFSICLDDKVEERIADHTSNVCSESIIVEEEEKNKIYNNDIGGGKNKDKDNVHGGAGGGGGGGGGGQRGLFAKRTLQKGEILTSSPTIPIHIDEMNLYHKENDNDNLSDDSDTIKRKQLLLNYCYGHPDSSLLWLPTAPLLLSVNHASSGSGGSNNNNDPTSTTANTKKLLQPNARIQWHHDEYDNNSIATEQNDKITKRQRFHHLELLDMPTNKVVKTNGMGLMMDLISLRKIYEDEEILIDYGNTWNNRWIEHEKQWNIELDNIKEAQKVDKNKRKVARHKEHELIEEMKENSKTNPDLKQELHIEHHHKQKEVHNSMTSKPYGSYITANEYTNQHSTEIIRTISEQHHKPYPTNIQTACFFEIDWLDDNINEDVDSSTVTYESWYKQDDHFDSTMGGGCMLPCIIMERRDYVDNEEKSIRNGNDDDDDVFDDDIVHDDDISHIDKLKQLKGGTETHNFGGSSYKERYTAKLIDTHEDNTSIDYDCHIYKRFEYIYEDLPREGIIFVNKPHSTDVWLPKAYREPIGLPDDMVPNIWKDLLSKSQQKQAASTGGGGGEGGKRMRGGGGGGKKMDSETMAVPLKKMNDYVHKDLLTKPINPVEEHNYQKTLNRWTDVETRRERLSEMEEKKSGVHPNPGSELLGLQEL